VSLLGDGALMFSIQEIVTAVEQRLRHDANDADEVAALVAAALTADRPTLIRLAC
jgi:thiamine pyrophosphate-dependent acetolactate synthase large subunit-like protein